MIDSVVEVWRGDVVESQHRVHVAVVDATGKLRGSTGRYELVTFARSAIKPVQALPLVEDGGMDQFGLDESELALACGSHSGEVRHVEGVRSMLRKIGLDEAALACGAHAPLYEPAARELRRHGERPRRIHNNCSGKHAGMLALARRHEWSVADYHEVTHEVQRRMSRELARWSEVAEDDMSVAIDGCGVATFALPLAAMAAAFARVASAARRGEGAPARVVAAMVQNPEMVGGTDRLCTQLMRVSNGRLFVKVGAEGVYCAGIPGAELGIALKIEDGAKRAAECAIVHVLKLLSLISAEEMGQLDRFARPDVVNTRDEVVGVVCARIQLEAARG